ncbi:TonB family protein [Gilvimarinus sp. SDUM040013]|uniref:Protein TonB n=1 Tax=Gilvimarinus gilvus TaxID=3058038 RepID=A0ABU4S012_9GAMM|nr:energy transducer TonB [Gilvimarinus sp. SDUM040013]MDO3386244.1 TonB family protein [Gilvimarinus sp. SDUM040013]MDX6849761.1 TonB family protein [Gilvimarinus sp. SDUM040013]
MSTAQLNVARFTAVPLGLMATLALLFMMASLIKTDFTLEAPPPAVPIGKVVMPVEKKIVVEYEKPARPEDPPQTPVTPFDQPAVSVEVTFNPHAVTPPAVAKGGPVIFDGTGGDLLPILKVAPMYPTRASTRGIEGEVIVAFTVTRTGATRDIQVVSGYRTNGEPTSIFDSAAIAAAEKFKYKPRVIDGEPVEVHNVQNKFVFEMQAE